MNKFSLENKVILVSGATSGIGLELCKQIVINGGNFIGMGRNISALQEFIDENKLSNSKALIADFTQEESILASIESIDKIDGYVHSAGIVQNNPIQFFNKDLYNQIRTINLDSSLLILSQLLKKKKFISIIR